MFVKNKIRPPETCPPGAPSPAGSPVGGCSCCDDLKCSIKYMTGGNRVLIPLGIIITHGRKVNLGITPTANLPSDASPTTKARYANPGCYDDPELELIDFTINVKNCDITDAWVEIKTTTGKVLFKDNLKNPKPRPFHKKEGTPDYLKQGEYRWQWDGYNSSDILDTAALKADELQAVLTTVCNGATKEWSPPTKLNANITKSTG